MRSRNTSSAKVFKFQFQAVGIFFTFAHFIKHIMALLRKTWYLNPFHNDCSSLIHFVYRPSKTSCSITDGVKKRISVWEGGWQHSAVLSCCCCMKTRLLPIHFLQKDWGVCVCVSECVLTRVKDLVGKQTKTHAVATLPSLASRHPPYHKPQPNSCHASHTHTHTPTPNELLPKTCTHMPQGCKLSALLQY